MSHFGSHRAQLLALILSIMNMLGTSKSIKKSLLAENVLFNRIREIFGNYVNIRFCLRGGRSQPACVPPRHFNMGLGPTLINGQFQTDNNLYAAFVSVVV